MVAVRVGSSHRTRPRGSLLLLALAASLALVACENADPRLFPDPLDPGDSDGTVSLSRQVQPIFTLSCVPCHGGASPEFNLSLEPGRLYDPVLGAVGVQSLEQPPLLRIEPGASASSYLVRKITGSGIAGDRMPPGGALSAEAIDTIREWIDDGAPNN